MKVLRWFRAAWFKFRKFVSQWSRKQRFWAVLSLVLVFALATPFLTRERGSESPKNYTGSLSELVDNIKYLDRNLDIPENDRIGLYLDGYQAALNGIEKPCHRMIQLKRPNSTDQGKAAGERIKGICEDLVNVTEYSRLLHQRIRSYLLLPEDKWPEPGSDRFTRRLDEVNQVAGQTRQSLESLDNTRVKDPALPELLIQVKEAQALAQKLTQTTNNPESSKQLAEQLRKQLAADKSDFLSARRYFWKNTIGIEKLIKALADIQTELEPPSPAPYK